MFSAFTRRLLAGNRPPVLFRSMGTPLYIYNNYYLSLSASQNEKAVLNSVVTLKDAYTE